MTSVNLLNLSALLKIAKSTFSLRSVYYLDTILWSTLDTTLYSKMSPMFYDFLAKPYCINFVLATCSGQSSLSRH